MERLEAGKIATFVLGLFAIFLHILAIPVLANGLILPGAIISLLGISLDLLLYKILSENLDVLTWLSAKKAWIVANQDSFRVALVGSLSFAFHICALVVLANGLVGLGFLLAIIALLYDWLLKRVCDNDKLKTPQNVPNSYPTWKICSGAIFSIIIHLSMIAALSFDGVWSGLAVLKISILWDIILFLAIKDDNRKIKT